LSTQPSSLLVSDLENPIPRRARPSARVADATASMMRRTAVLVVALSLVLTVQAASRQPLLPDLRLGQTASNASGSDSSLSGCETCCGGGTCDSAFKNTPGTCCGVLNDKSFCCPTSNSTFGDASCVRSGDDVFTCLTTSGKGGFSKSKVYVSPWYSLFSLFIPIALFAACCMACFRKPGVHPPQQVMVPYGQTNNPYGGQAYGYPPNQNCQNHQSQTYQNRNAGYGASNLAGAGASAPPPPSELPTSDQRMPSAPPYAQQPSYYPSA